MSEQMADNDQEQALTVRLRALLDAGYAARENGQHERARTFFERALELDPVSVEAHLGLASIIKDESLQRAIYERILEIDPDNADAQARLADLSKPSPEPAQSEIPEGVPEQASTEDIDTDAEAQPAELPQIEPSGAELYVPPWQIDIPVPVLADSSKPSSSDIQNEQEDSFEEPPPDESATADSEQETEHLGLWDDLTEQTYQADVQTTPPYQSKLQIRRLPLRHALREGSLVIVLLVFASLAIISGVWLRQRERDSTPMHAETIAPINETLEPAGEAHIAIAIPSESKASTARLPFGDQARWVEVDLAQNMLRAYEGQRMVYAATIAAYRHATIGLPEEALRSHGISPETIAKGQPNLYALLIPANLAAANSPGYLADCHAIYLQAFDGQWLQKWMGMDKAQQITLQTGSRTIAFTLSP